MPGPYSTFTTPFNNYQQNYQQNYVPANVVPQAPAAQQPTTTMIWVQGESGAKAYPVAAGTSQVLFNSEDETFFIKTMDMSGMPQPLREFVYREKTAEELKENHIDVSQFITRDEFNDVIDQLKQRSYQRKEKVNNNGKQSII